MKTGEICNRNVVVAHRDATLADAAKLMRENHVGSIVVLDGAPGRRPVGILTDRDIVVEVIAADMDPRAVSVGDIMGDRLVTALEDDDAHATLTAMRRRGIRRIPVVTRDSALVGIVTLDDLIGLVGRELMDVVQAIGSEQQLEGWRRP
jgi:CBS domain-containing protein